MKLNSLKDLYQDELKDLYSAETQLLKALPKMAKSATSPLLQAAFNAHLEQTKEHAHRIERLFQSLEGNPGGKKCRGMEGLIAEGDEMRHEDAEPEVRDAGLIAAAQRVEHYEIAVYGTVRTYAQLLGFSDHVKVLQETLDEEGEADKKLTALAESSINLEAKAGR